MIKKILLWSLLILGLIQLIPVDRKNPVVIPQKDIIYVTGATAEEAKILKNSCYDCHSNESRYPKYAYIAPMSWVVKDHINGGRESVNFSEWGSYNSDQKKRIAMDAQEEVHNGEMPISSYTMWNPKAILSASDKDVLKQYFAKILKFENASQP